MNNDELRKQIERQVEEYLKSGRMVQTIPTGERTDKPNKAAVLKEDIPYVENM